MIISTNISSDFINKNVGFLPSIPSTELPSLSVKPSMTPWRRSNCSESSRSWKERRQEIVRIGHRNQTESRIPEFLEEVGPNFSARPPRRPRIDAVKREMKWTRLHNRYQFGRKDFKKKTKNENVSVCSFFNLFDQIDINLYRLIIFLKTDNININNSHQ